VKSNEFEGFNRPKDFFGGAHLKNSHARSKRPLESKLPIHLCLRSNLSLFRLPKNYKKVNETEALICRKHVVKTYEYANVGNHLHLLIRIPSVRRWAAFIRELTGRLAQIAQGLKLSEKDAENFWKQRPFTRIVRGWRKAFKITKEYLQLNHLEAEGYISRKDTKTLRDLRTLLSDGFD